MDFLRLSMLLTDGEALTATEAAARNLPTVSTATSGDGTNPVTDFVTVKYVPGAMTQVKLTCTALPVAVANTTGISFGSLQILDFAQGRIAIDGGTTDLSVSWADSAAGSGELIALDGSGDFAFGTTATADGTINSTEVDLMASTAMTDPFVLGVGDANGVFVKDTEFDGTTTAKDAFLNVIIDDADVADTDNAIIYFTGEIILHCKWLGDF